MKHHAPVVLLLILSVLLAINPGMAAERDIDKLKTQQQQLQSLLEDIEQTAQQRAQHHAQIKRLKHQLECNWTLIRSYEICGQLHHDNPQAHLDCSSTARRTAATCLESGNTE